MDAITIELRLELDPKVQLFTRKPTDGECWES